LTTETRELARADIRARDAGAPEIEIRARLAMRLYGQHFLSADGHQDRFFGCGYEPFDESEFERRRLVTPREGSESLFVKSPEDTVLRKLLWFREGGEVSALTRLTRRAPRLVPAYERAEPRPDTLAGVRVGTVHPIANCSEPGRVDRG
jgi:hypothetical protein